MFPVVLQCFETVGWAMWPVDIVPEMTCSVSPWGGGGALCSTRLNHFAQKCRSTVWTKWIKIRKKPQQNVITICRTMYTQETTKNTNRQICHPHVNHCTRIYIAVLHRSPNTFYFVYFAFVDSDLKSQRIPNHSWTCVPFCWRNPIDKYLVLNRTRKLCATNYSNDDF